MNRYLMLFGIIILALEAAWLLVNSFDTLQDISAQQTSDITNMSAIGNRTGVIANETQPFNPQEPIK